ncbi:hypothetical protein BJX65DRAFT_299433 [Aspergillus insuetus]
MPELISFVEIAGTVSSLFVSVSVGGVNTTKLAVTVSPVLAAQQWENVYSRSHKVGTPLVVFSAACFSWLKYKTNNSLYRCAAASCMSIVPYTVLILSVPERTLFAAVSAKHRSHLVPSMREVQQALGQ